MASGKAVDLAASGFCKVWGKNTSPIFCPHTVTRPDGMTYDPLVLALSGNHESGVADFYRALDHRCTFKGQ